MRESMNWTRSKQWGAFFGLLSMLANRALAQQVYIDVDRSFPVFSVYDGILAKDTNNAAAYRERGTAYYHQEDFEKAIADYNQAIARNSKDAIAYAGRGMSHFKQNDLDDAIADLHHAVRLNPNSAAIYHHLVDAYWSKGDWDNVITNATQIIRVNPSQSAWACDIRGSAYREKGDLDRALKEFETAIRLSPNWDAPHEDHGIILSRKGDLDGAIADLNEAIRLNPKRDGFYYTRAAIYREKGDWDADIANWTEAIANIPSEVWLLTERAQDYQIHKKDFSKAIADYNKAVELSPGYYRDRALAYQRENLNDKAIVDFTKAIEYDRTTYYYFVERADAYFKNGQYKAAREDLDHAIQLNPNGWSSYSELAYCLATCPDASLRNGEEALKMAHKGCDLNPNNGTDCTTALAAAYAETGNFDDAIRYQKESLDRVLDRIRNDRGWGVSDEDIKKMKDRLALFEQHKPYREPLKRKPNP